MEAQTVLEHIEAPVLKPEIPIVHLVCKDCKTICCLAPKKAGSTRPLGADAPEDCMVCEDLWAGWALTHKCIPKEEDPDGKE